MMHNGYVFDLETDNLYPFVNKIWYGCFISLDGKRELEIFPEKWGKRETTRVLKEWHSSFGEKPLVVTHNGLGFDHWVLWKLLGIPFRLGKNGSDWFGTNPVQFVDTYVMSMYLDPDRKGPIPQVERGKKRPGPHSVASYGCQFGLPKLDSPEFSEYSEEMRVYGMRDTKIQLRIFNYLLSKYYETYPNYTVEFHPSFKRMQKDYYLYSAQSFTGIKFDVEAAQRLLAEVTQEMQAIEEEILPQLPKRGLKKGEEDEYRMPKNPWIGSGDFSYYMKNFIEKHNAEIIDRKHIKIYGETVAVESQKLIEHTVPMELKDGVEIKQWLMSEGWEPTMWNYKKDPQTKKIIRDSTGEPIPTTPKINDGATICSNLMEMGEEAGTIASRIAKWFSLRNRQGVVSGWLAHPRLQWDGRLPASISGYTYTGRVKHQVITNIPSADPKVTKGAEMRSLFIVDEDMMYGSADASSLENRTLADWTYKHDNGEFAKRVLEGDSHSENAKYAFFVEELKDVDIHAPDFDKDSDLFKPYRKRSKNGGYALPYGCSEEKLAKVLWLPPERAKAAFEGYWNLNWGLRDFRDEVTNYWKGEGGKKHILAKDGQVIFTRSKHSLVNSAGQSSGALVIAYAFCFLDNKLGNLVLDNLGRPYYNYKGKVVKRVAAFHDQGDFELSPEIADEVCAMFVKCMTKAGQYLNMSLPIVGEYKVGKTAKDIH